MKDIEQKVNNILNAIDEEGLVDTFVEDGEADIIREVPSLLKSNKDDGLSLIGLDFGHWTIVKQIGKGGMSTIYLAERNDDQLQQKVALKVLPHGFSQESMAKRFIRERQILADLNHQNIAKLYDVGVTETGNPWFVMEWVDGVDILTFAESHGLNVEQKIALFIQVCDALAYAHSAGIVHRDIKPANILVTDDQRVKLLDFGIAANNEQQSLTLTGAIMGTPGYMSPEQAKGLNSRIDRRSDVFSAGVLLYKLIRGEMPFNADSISEISYKIIHEEPELIGTGVAADIQAIIFKCLEKDVESRYGSFKQLKEDLTAYLNGDVVSARKVTFAGRMSKKIKKNKAVASGVISALLLAVFGLGYGIYQSVASYQKIALTKKYLAITETIKNNIRRTHMMPFHNVQEAYNKFEAEIKTISEDIRNENFDDTGLSDFAIGTAYFDMRKGDKAWEYFKASENKGFQSLALYSGLGQLNADQWRKQKQQASSIQNQEKRQQFLDEAKKQYYDPALGYLSKAQVDQAEAYYLGAYVAYVEGKYEQVIALTQKEIKNNPWHYEALVLAADAYSEMAHAKGLSDGQDTAKELLQLSNDMLNQAIQIGGSDPQNYSKKCVFLGRDIQYQKFFNHEETENIYQSSLSVCQDAIALNPNQAAPYIGLFNLHRARGEYQEYLDRTSLNKYNNFVSDEALVFYRKSLDVLEQGLQAQSENFDLLLLQIKPLYMVAYHAYLNQMDPMPYYRKALNDINVAKKLNLESARPWLEQAAIYSEMAHYFMTQVKDLQKAEGFAQKAIDSAIEANNIDPNFTKVIRINAYRYSLANVKFEQGQLNEAIKILRQSIRERFKVLPKRSSFFKNHNDIMRANIVLLDLLVENNEPLSDDVQFGLNMMGEVCDFKGLLPAQELQITKLIKTYQENNWGAEDYLVHCE